MSERPGNTGTYSLPPLVTRLPQPRGLGRGMIDSQFARFVVTKPADVVVAARKARILAALADVEKMRRTRFGKAVTEACRSVLAFGGRPEVAFGLVELESFDGQTSVEVTVEWMNSADSQVEHPRLQVVPAANGTAVDLSITRRSV